MNNNLKEALEYVYLNKNGLKIDLIKKFDENIYETLIYSNLIIPCVRKTNDLSWKISKDGYDLYISLNPEKQYKYWSTKLNDFLDEILYFKSKRKEDFKNKKIKEDYFK